MPLRVGDTLPSFEGATDWLNGSGEKAEEFVKEHPALVYFWSASCEICKENMPKLGKLKEKYPDLKMAAIHMPRYEADTNLERVKEIIEQYRITDICAVDNKHKLKNAFLNDQGWVPFYYLFNADGKLKSRSAGEHGISVITKALEKFFVDITSKIVV